MATTRLPRRNLVVAATAFLFAICHGSPTLAGSIVRVNNSSETNQVLSDLIAYGVGDEKNTILQLNNAGDDITLAPHETRTFDAGFDVKRYFVSVTNQGSEFEAHCFDVRTLQPRKLGFFGVFGTGQPLFPSLDDQQAVAPLANGTIVDFTDGLSPLLPGWFLGTGADFDGGEVTGAFTGQGQVVLGELEVTTVPEPSTLTLLSLAAVGGLGHVRARNRRRTPANKGLE